MSNSLYIPEKIKVGYQKRSDTYTGMLAYIIYYDNENKLRKANSWHSWRDKNIEPQDFKNEPISGFVLNKKTGGYAGYYGNFRQAYVRVYDPRGFEFEITVPNLLFILENCSSYQGKGLEGEFVYSWDGKDLVLLPTNCADYKELLEKSRQINKNEFIKPKDFKVGYTYVATDNKQYIYLGKFDKYYWNGEKYTTKYHWFGYIYDDKTMYIDCFSNPNKKFIREIQGINERYSEAVKEIEKDIHYSPISVKETAKLDLDLLNGCSKLYYYNSFYCYTEIENKTICIQIELADRKNKNEICLDDKCRVYYRESYSYLFGKTSEYYKKEAIYNKYIQTLGYDIRYAPKMTIEEIIKYFQPEILIRKQQNGNIYDIGAEK